MFWGMFQLSVFWQLLYHMLEYLLIYKRLIVYLVRWTIFLEHFWITCFVPIISGLRCNDPQLHNICVHEIVGILLVKMQKIAKIRRNVYNSANSYAVYNLNIFFIFFFLSYFSRKSYKAYWKSEWPSFNGGQ